MKAFYTKPLDDYVSDSWKSIDPSYRKAALFVVGINILAFGFEMTSLTLHHDDVAQFFIQDEILGYYLGRFGLGTLYYYSQNAYFMPFLQMVEGIASMTAYGLLVARFWGVTRTWDITLVAAILCVFPFMAQIYQYNTAMAMYPLAHCLAAVAVVLSTRASVGYIAASALLYFVAFSIYQSVVANSATIICVWLLSKIIFSASNRPLVSMETIKAVGSAIISVCAGGILYATIVVTFIDLSGDSIHAASEAFSLGDRPGVLSVGEQVLQGTRAFLLWPEHYFPGYLKGVQLVLLMFVAVLCVWRPTNVLPKLAALALLIATIMAPRLLEMGHPQGNYHNLAFTAYAVFIAGVVMIGIRTRPTVVRNGVSLLAAFLVVGYVVQCNWVSTVNYLNTLAHMTTLTQVLARLRGLPDAEWDGKTIAVVGRYNMSSDYPYRAATGVATKFIDAPHMQHLARLLRDEAKFIDAQGTLPKALEYAAQHEPWPHPSSVGIVDGMGVVVLSKGKTGGE